MTYTLITSGGKFAEAMRYNHNPVTFTGDINRCFWCDVTSECDMIELNKIINKLKADGVTYDYLYLRDGDHG
jgi:hypothetical protein